MRRLPALLAVIFLGAGAAAADPAPARRAELMYLLKQDCGSCHGMTLKGGLGSPLSPEVLAGRTTDDLTDIILNGVPGTPMPPWRPLLSVADARWLADVLKEGKARP